MMEFSKWKNFLVVFISLEILAVGVSYVLNDGNDFIKQAVAVSGALVGTNSNNSAPIVSLKLNNPPKIINAIFVTGYSAGSKKYLNYLSNLFATTEINAVVIDIKGSDGNVTYASGAPDVKKYNLYKGAIKDIDGLLKFLHDKNIYVIGRIAVFEDPMYSKARPELAIYNKIETANSSKTVLWYDKNKLSWLDPASKDVWDYNISLAKDAASHGFDEINFDYVRFPSDGKVGETGYPVWDGLPAQAGKKLKADVIKEFFHYLRTNLPNEKLSVDLFGQTTTNTDDMGIGQLLENAFENFDYISPMVYPSHYINGFMGFVNPADHPYEIIKYSMETALAREKAYLANSIPNATGANPSSPGPTQEALILAKFRPWLQDFNMGANYTADMVRAEIRATQDALGPNYEGFMLWNPSNIYNSY